MAMDIPIGNMSTSSRGGGAGGGGGFDHGMRMTASAVSTGPPRQDATEAAV